MTNEQIEAMTKDDDERVFLVSAKDFRRLVSERKRLLDALKDPACDCKGEEWRAAVGYAEETAQ